MSSLAYSIDFDLFFYILEGLRFVLRRRLLQRISADERDECQFPADENGCIFVLVAFSNRRLAAMDYFGLAANPFIHQYDFSYESMIDT